MGDTRQIGTSGGRRREGGELDICANTPPKKWRVGEAGKEG